MTNTIKEAAYPKPMARLSVTSSIKCKTLTTQCKSGRNLQSRIKNKPKRTNHSNYRQIHKPLAV